MPTQSYVPNISSNEVDDEVTVAEEVDDDVKTPEVNDNDEEIKKDDSDRDDGDENFLQNYRNSEMSNSCVMGNSIISGTGWSSSHDRLEVAIDLDNPERNQTDSSSQFSRMNSMTTSISSPIDHHSFNTLLEKYDNRSSLNKQKLSFNELWERFESTLDIDNDSVSTITMSDSHHVDPLIGSELIRSGKYTIDELHNMVEMSCKIAHEPGLDAQGYVCKSCANPLGIGFSKAQYIDKYI